MRKNYAATLFGFFFINTIFFFAWIFMRKNCEKKLCGNFFYFFRCKLLLILWKLFAIFELGYDLVKICFFVVFSLVFFFLRFFLNVLRKRKRSRQKEKPDEEQRREKRTRQTFFFVFFLFGFSNSESEKEIDKNDTPTQDLRKPQKTFKFLDFSPLAYAKMFLSAKK